MRGSCSILALSLLLPVGCDLYKPGGNPWFDGPTSPTTWNSTEHSPKTITIMDTRSGERVFLMEIPVGKKLVIDFEEGGGDDTVQTPDLMRWEVFNHDIGRGALNNAMTVPNATCRRIDVRMRPGTEYAQPEPDRTLRVDELQDRPDWWTPEGGEIDTYDPLTGYDG